MPSNITNILRDDAVQAFSDADAGYAEQITYTPRGDAPRTFTAHVFRHIPEDVFGTDRAVPMTEVWVPYSTDPTKGVESVNIGGDVVSVADRQGGEATDRQITQRISQDAGGWMLRLR